MEEAREVTAIHRYARISDQKAREVARVVSGMSIPHALSLLNFVPKKAARMLYKVLRSAIANAENVHQIDPENLYVKSCVAQKGPMLKRIMPRARGSAAPIRKRMCHLHVILGPKPEGSVIKAGYVVMPRKSSEASKPKADSAAEARKRRVERSKKKSAASES